MIFVSSILTGLVPGLTFLFVLQCLEVSVSSSVESAQPGREVGGAGNRSQGLEKREFIGNQSGRECLHSGRQGTQPESLQHPQWDLQARQNREAQRR